MSSKSKEEGRRIFGKSISLMETRMGVKVRRATLLIDTDFGLMTFHLSDDIPTFQMTTKYMAEKLNTFALAQATTSMQLVTCSECIGSGEILESDKILSTCGKCKGGGQMVVLINATGE